MVEATTRSSWRGGWRTRTAGAAGASTARCSLDRRSTGGAGALVTTDNRTATHRQSVYYGYVAL
jgi:hypothetical protein